MAEATNNNGVGKNYLLHEIADKITQWAKFARLIGIDEPFIQRTDIDKKDCYEKAITCLNKKVESITNELDWLFWRKKLILLGGEGKYAIRYLESKYPKLSENINTDQDVTCYGLGKHFNILREIAERISNWKDFAKIIGLDEDTIRQITTDKAAMPDCDKAYACIYKKDEHIRMQQSWSFWKKHLLNFKDEGEFVVKDLESKFPGLLENNNTDWAKDEAVNILNEIAERISKWKDFAKVIRLEDYTIGKIDVDKKTCHEKTYACILEKNLSNYTQTSWSFWKKHLLNLKYEGEFVVKHLELKFPELLKNDTMDGKLAKDIDHQILSGRKDAIIGHNDQDLESFATMKIILTPTVKIIVGAGEGITIHEDYDNWLETKKKYCERYDLKNKDLCYNFSEFARYEQCKVLRTLSDWLKLNKDNGFVIKGYDICAHFNILSRDHPVIADQNKDSYLLMYCQKDNVMLHIDTALNNIAMSFRNNLYRIKTLRSLYEEIKENSIIHISVILLRGDFAKNDGKDICKVCDALGLITTTESFESKERFESWWERLKPTLEKVKMNMVKNISTEEISCNLLTSIITYTALTYCHLPSFSNDPIEHIDNAKKLLMFTSEQTDILHCEDKHMVLVGSFGSGKSLVAQERFKRVVETESNLSSEAISYYICHDQESAFITEMNKFVKTDEKLKDANIIVCSSFDLVGDDYNLSSILNYILRNNEDKTVNIFLEEFNGEIIDKEEIQKLIPLLKTKQFANSHIVIVAQSMKYQMFNKEDPCGPTPFLKYLYKLLSNQTDFKIFPLNYVMRYSNSIKKLVDIAIQALEDVKEKFIIPKKEDITDITPKTEKEARCKDGLEIEHRAQEPDQVNTHSKKFDTLIKACVESPYDNKLHDTVESRFQFPGKRINGHNVEGEKPELYYPFLSENKSTEHQLYSLILILRKIITTEITSNFTIIYFNDQCNRYLYTALKAMGIEFATHPEEIVKGKKKILLAKYATVRGCEFSDVILAYPLNEKYRKQNIVSGLSRCKMNLKIVVFDHTLSYRRSLYLDTDDGILLAILKKWRKEKLVITYKLNKRSKILSDSSFYLKGKSSEESLSNRIDFMKFKSKHIRIEEPVDADFGINDPDILRKIGLEDHPKKVNSVCFRELREAYEIAEKTSNYNVLRTTFNPVINSTYNGDTILHYYIHEANKSHNENEELNISQTSSSRFSYFQKVILMLLRQTNIDTNIQDADGKTALHWAVTYNNELFVHEIITAGIDINKIDQSGKTALEYAIELDRSNIVNILEEKTVNEEIVPFPLSQS